MSDTHTSEIGVLIDLDGTLVDSAGDIHHAVNLALRGLAVRELPLALVKTFIGRGVDHLIRQVCKACEPDAQISHEVLLRAFMQHYMQVNGHFSQVFPGVVRGLSALKNAGYRLACVTNKPQALAADVLQKLNLAHYFDLVAGAEPGRKLKPDPAPLFYASAQLQLDTHSCVMVGDSEIDLTAAISAGMHFYMVEYGYRLSPGAWRSDAMDMSLIPSLETLPDLLKQHFREKVGII